MKKNSLFFRLMLFACILMLINNGQIYAQGEGEATPSNIAPVFTFIEPQQETTIRQGDSISIKWTDEDPDDNAIISLAYSLDTDLSNNEIFFWIAQNVLEDIDEEGDLFIWDTSSVPAGTYYIWAIITDGTNAPVYVLSTSTIIILETQTPVEEPTIEPSEEPTKEPTQTPTNEPTLSPTEEPTVEPTYTPTIEPSEFPTYLVDQHLSQDGLTLFNAISPLIVIADPNQSMAGQKEPQSAEVASAIADPTNASSTIFSITYASAGETDPWGATCQTFPTNAKTAFNAAAAIWANTIQSSVPITIYACWSDLGSSSILGYSGGQPLHRDFSGAPLSGTWYQGALANSIYGSDLSTSSYDDYITYNSNFTWYYGTDGNTPSGYYDLVTVAAHEIAHGLNFSGSASYSGGTGSYEYSGYPVVYDIFVEDSSGNKLSTYTNPSTSLGSLFTSNNLWFDGTNADAANGGSRVKIYAPSTWSSGSSYAHLDYSTFAGTSNSLMVYAVSSGSSQHNPGAVTKGILKDMGWILASTTPSPLSPSGVISDTTPTYTWTKVSGATKYQYQLYQGSTRLYAYTVSSSICGSSNCSATPTTVLSGGDYSWRVGAYVDSIWNAFSSNLNFTVEIPVTPTTISPSGTTTDTTPTFIWSKISGATKYQYQLYKGSNRIYAYTVTSTVCGSSSCSATPSNVLSASSYEWRVGAYVDGTWRTFSANKSFSVSLTPTPSSPSGTITGNTPPFTWSKIPTATKYQLQLYKDGTRVYAMTVYPSACGTSSCSNTPSTALSAGSYEWRVGAYVNGVWQSFSENKSFTINFTPNPSSPSSTIYDITPTYTWNKISAATKYQYQLYQGSTRIYAKTVTSDVCGTSSCSDTPSTALSAGLYEWRVGAYVNGAWQSFSANKSFTLEANFGFDSQFNGSISGWARKSGGTWSVSSSALYTNGQTESWSSAYRTTAQYDSFDYFAKVKRIGGVEDGYYPASYLVVRMGNNLDTSNNSWYPGYSFGYSNLGNYSIWLLNSDGSSTSIQPWTYSSTIKVDDWNTFRILAMGNTFYFYINGTLVNSFTNTYRTTGYVGFTMYKFSTSTQFLVDWSTLNILTGSYSVADIVSTEQQALNEAAKLTSNIGSMQGSINK